MIRSLGLAALLTAVAAAPAHAATVAVVERSSGGDRLVFEAAPGEVNDLTILERDGEYVFRDPEAPVAAGDGCRAVGAHEVACVAARTLAVRLGDGPDDLDDQLAGVGPGGVARSIAVEGGSGDDALQGTGVVDGGPGRDTLSGTASGDVLRGGAGDDVLTGGRGADAIEGGDGDDLIDGGAGDDLLAGGAGRDRFVGGTGDDLLDLRPAPPANELLRCGNGRGDAVAGTTSRLFVPRFCELVVARSGRVVTTSRPVRLARGVATYRVRCLPAAGGERCAVRLDAGRNGRSGTARIASGRSALVRMRLTPAGRRAAGRARVVRIDVREGARRTPFRGTLRPQ